MSRTRKKQKESKASDTSSINEAAITEGGTGSSAAQPSDDGGYVGEEEIAIRAYEIYLERGGAEGNPDDDWLKAERELRAPDNQDQNASE